MKKYGRHQTSVDFYVPPVLYRSRCISFAIQCSKSSNATLLFFFCALYTPHHIYKSFPTYYDHHVNCPLLSVDVRIMLMSSVEQPARRMGSLCCSCTAVLLYCCTGVSQLVTSSAEKVLPACTHACSSEQTMLHTTQQQ